MLERLVAWVLNNYLGKYVENLNTDQLSIALMRGSVELENLPLKKDALRHFGLPIKLKSGFIGKVKLKIPVTQIRSAPWHICIEDVTIVVSPIHLSEWDKDLEEQAAHEYKLSLLDSMEVVWRTTRSAQQESGYYASSYQSWFSYGSGLVTNIVENLQLQIKDVHFRYEDSLSMDNESYAMGVVIESLLVQSCDENWKPTYMTANEKTKFSFQLLQLTGFSIYWDTLTECLFWGDLDLAQLAVKSKRHTEEGHSYILLPVSARSHVKRNRSTAPLRSRTHPRIMCNLQLDSVPFSLSDVQYNEIIGCVKGLSTVQQCQRYIHLRPSTSVKENPKAWWVYAIKCDRLRTRGSVEEFPTWEISLQKARENVTYVKMYTSVLSSPVESATNLPPDMKEFKNKIEWERGFEELRALREVAMLRVKVPTTTAPPAESKTSKKEGQSALFRWFPQWRGWYSGGGKEVEPAEEEKLEEENNFGQLEEEILDVLADTLENNTILKRDTVFGQFNFELKEGTFSLISNRKNVMELQFSKVKLELESRPRTSSSKVSVSLGGITLYDRLTDDSVFPVLISPQNSENAPSSRMNRSIPPTVAKILNQSSSSVTNVADCLFQLTYEVKPFSSPFDYKFHIWSQSLDVVYNPEATKWLVEFFTKPHQSIDYELRQAAKQRYNAMKQRTKEEIMKNWDNILQGNSDNRKHWDIKLDISAPQIFLVERFYDKNTVLCIVDFGKLFFTNQNMIQMSIGSNANFEDCSSTVQKSSEAGESDESDDEFATPCTTPPEAEGSETSGSRKLSTEEKFSVTDIGELDLHNKVYDSYKLEFSELQILLGRMKDNWKFAHLKGTSSLHVVDRFNITLQVDRRIVNMADPNFPALTVTGNLPKLVVHTNEQKIQALCTIFDTIQTSQNVPSPQKSEEAEWSEELIVRNEQSGEEELKTPTLPEVYDNPESRLLQIQFIVDQLALEVQSRGRCIAELQVAGVKLVCIKRPFDTDLCLSVHSLLLVDALQTFGPDFELLVASHKHVGMDSISGSLRDSEPTSPASPASPELPPLSKIKITTPQRVSQILNSTSTNEEVLTIEGTPKGMTRSPATSKPIISASVDTEALILVNVLLVQGKGQGNPNSETEEDAQIVNIQFNNLDIVANQETIVELISFSKRILSHLQSKPKPADGAAQNITDESEKSSLQLPLSSVQSQLSRTSPTTPAPRITKTELTFDFHRLSVLLLRSVMSDGGVAVAKKIATATMMSAKVHAVVGNDLSVEGSLGGIQILDLTSEGHIHQRILSLGQDPLKVEKHSKEKKPGNLFEHLSATIYDVGKKPTPEKRQSLAENVQAFNFTVFRPSGSNGSSNEVKIKMKVSSALYTHAPHFVSELSSYATEFKQYLKNLAKSIGSAATEMAIGLVHARAETIAQSLSINNRFSFYGSTSDLTATPRKQVPQTPTTENPPIVGDEYDSAYSPEQDTAETLDMKLDVTVDTPVIVLPRFSTSYEVLVAHLGRITVSNSANDCDVQDANWKIEKYIIEIKDMNLYSLNTQKRFQMFAINVHRSNASDYPSVRPEDIYNCCVDAKPILHDTVIQLCVERSTKLGSKIKELADCPPEFENQTDISTESLEVSGKIITPLKVSLSREQYEQLLQTVDSVVADASDKDTRSSIDYASSTGSIAGMLPDIKEEGEYHTGLSAFDLDPALRASMLVSHGSSSKLPPIEEVKPFVIIKASFGIPVFTVELKANFGSGDQGLVDVSFCDFLLQFEKNDPQQTKMEVSLQSLVMEDLQKDPTSKHRYMMTSYVANTSVPPDVDYVSISCPSLPIVPTGSTIVTSSNTTTIAPMHSSLPDYLETETVFGGFSKKSVRPSVSSKIGTSHRKSQIVAEYPSTPPPSPRDRKRSVDKADEDNLVHIKVLTYTKESDVFKRNKLIRAVTVNFNALNVVVNLESWVIVLDFFTPAEQPSELNALPSTAQSQSKPLSRRPSFGTIAPASTVPEESDASFIQRTELDVTVKSLSVILNRTEYEVSHANISKFSASIVKTTNSDNIGDVMTIEGEIGSLSLHDLTPVHSKFYGERFNTSDLSIFLKKYSKPDKTFSREYDIMLKLSFPVMMYVHTQRFITEIQAYFKHFSHLQSIVSSIRSAKPDNDDDANLPMRMKIDVKAQSPVIILPVSSQSAEALMVDLGTLSVSNYFKWASPNEDSDDTQICLLDIMDIKLSNMDVYSGERGVCAEGEDRHLFANKSDCLLMGSYYIRKNRPSLLQENCELELAVERNLTSNVCKSVPDMSFRGVLSTLAIAVDLQHYKLLRSLLACNLGEPLEDLVTEEVSPFTEHQEIEQNDGKIWTTNCMRIDLVNVNVKLMTDCSQSPDESLACINFIKSQFTVESFSDKSQDIDLISQEILVTDTRFLGEPVNKRSNVFTNILQPLTMPPGNDNVRVEVHLRKRADLSKITVMLNNMRLMAIIDWWEMLRNFATSEADVPAPETVIQKTTNGSDKQSKTPPPPQPQPPFELKLNVTDSEVVILEDTSQWDTNAVIFKSTTVINFKPNEPNKPLSCNLNHCEMYSCILGMEDETALSIIDPLTVNCEIGTRLEEGSTERVKVLQILSQQLSLRLSYNDVNMFMRIADSIPKQMLQKQQSEPELAANIKNQVKSLASLGFPTDACMKALEQCNGNSESAALWLANNPPLSAGKKSLASSGYSSLARNATLPSSATADTTSAEESPVSFQFLELKTDCLSICIIDDCRDSDVPLLELSMTDLTCNLDLKSNAGKAECCFSIDYYNRFLSGWEPFIEPWSCSVKFNKMSSELFPNRMVLSVKAKDVLNVNVTRRLLDISQNVKESWTQDYYNSKEKHDTDADKVVKTVTSLAGPSNYRRRSPFVPFALRNNTGCQIWYITTVTYGTSVVTDDIDSAEEITEDTKWITVSTGETVPFSFEERGKLRHRDSRKVQSHQIVVRVDGWQPVKPLSVDRVGVYFRHAIPDNYSSRRDFPHARIIFDVKLEGSARKLVTIRSSLLLRNRLPLPVEVKLENTPSAHFGNSPTCWLVISPNSCEPVPLSHTHAQISLRPVNGEKPSPNFAFCNPAIFWQQIQKAGELVEEFRECAGCKGSSYRFCAVIQRENYPSDQSVVPSTSSASMSSIWTHPGHLITFVSPMVIINLLPYELHYNVNEIEYGRIKPGRQIALHEVSADIVTEIHFSLENYPGDGKIIVPSPPTSMDVKLKVEDRSGRRLNLRASVVVQKGSEIKVAVFVPYWIINKTALPLVFRQEGVATETAGQFEEHEIARMVAPLMFSLTDIDASPTVVARVGTGMHEDGSPQWCQHFHLQPGVQVRRLRVSLKDNRPDIIYMIGINIKRGRGRYRNTNIVTLTSHYQIHNKSSYTLQIAQKHLTSTVTDPIAQATYLQTPPNCCLSFHWPRQDKDQLLCIKIADISNCRWSGGFRIKNDAFHINIRDESDQMYFVRVEIVLQDATFFIIFTDAQSVPPPIRIDNFSEVAIEFHQSSCERHGIVRPTSSVSYAWDEPVQPLILTLIAPGGVSANYDVNKLGKATQLTYENFIYIAFAATFNKISENDTAFDPLDIQRQQLVLDVVDGRIILNNKEDGARSQLWRMTVEGFLQHEGSSPPMDPTAKRSSLDNKNILVLDISSPGIQPTEYVNLTLQKVNKRRKSTQTWCFTEDGRLCCVHNNLCVQARDGFFGLRKGSDAVLGPVQSAGNLQLTDTGVPYEQAICRQKLRPGSGCLDVNIVTDGPTRVIDIVDVKDKRVAAKVLQDGDWVSIESVSRPLLNTQEASKSENGQEFEINIDLPCGLGLSLITTNPTEELLFTRLAGIRLNFSRTQLKEALEFTIKDIQIDNQLFDTQYPVMLYVTPPTRSKDVEELSRPAVHVSFERMMNKTEIATSAEIFKSLLLRIKNLTVVLEDRLLLKLLVFSGYTSVEQEEESVEETDFEAQRILAEVTEAHAKRYYFEIMELIFGQVRMSVVTGSKLSPELRAVKKKLNLTLIKFEDAAIDLKPFTKFHLFETSAFLTHLIMKHFQSELKWQAAIILGSVDFLGNPLGFVNDISEGVSGLIYEGNIGGLVQNVAHGISNSAAKVTGTLSDGIGVMTMDDEHQEGRHRIRSQNPSGSGHIVAGLKGFGHGIVGGVTSVFKQTYEGASNEGAKGFITGFGKGLVGTVTKPVVGVLDLASETASAVRDSSRSKMALTRIRKPRCVVGPTGLLPVYSMRQSLGQEYLYTINHGNYAEIFVAYEILRSGADDLQIIVSNEKVRVFSCNTGTIKGCSVVIETNLSDLVMCQPVIVQEGVSEHLYYIELVVREGRGQIKRPRVRCDNEKIVSWVSEQVNYARNMYVEKQHTLVSSVDGIAEE